MPIKRYKAEQIVPRAYLGMTSCRRPGSMVAWAALDSTVVGSPAKFESCRSPQRPPKGALRRTCWQDFLRLWMMDPRVPRFGSGITSQRYIVDGGWLWCVMSRLHILPRRSSVRRKQIATIRKPPKSKAMSPMLNIPSLAWSASSGNCVCNVAPFHSGLAGRTMGGIPTTGIDPAFLSVTRAFIPSPQSISRTPVRAKGD